MTERETGGSVRAAFAQLLNQIQVLKTGADEEAVQSPRRQSCMVKFGSDDYSDGYKVEAHKSKSHDPSLRQLRHQSAATRRALDEAIHRPYKHDDSDPHTVYGRGRQ